MNLTRTAVGLLRVFLVLLLVLCVVGQFLSWPGQFAHLAQEEPLLAHLRWPLTATAILVLVGVEVVVVCVWRLLGMVTADRIFSPQALRWVDGIVWALAATWLVAAAGSLALGITIFATPELRDPGVPALLVGMLLAAAVVVLLMVVMRALLRQAVALRTDMDAVI
ncbi:MULTISPECIES: DUF2975 domain-containing protein [unclassified Actinotalea]|uniref:DUF2975 domain-containing protein n=1 Tax=unclassified Actinotalea TaxID=2638618 RepID=UPI0015F6EFE9|nr:MULTISPECIES: DUF2975 domain-containing protein [unclassified Actinotalea]